ncbi:MAG: hypothetical protein B6V02_03255 [Thermoprotei archaeon ex4572_64]|nr:MAG: hypothetical protein B6V02_03255 [Thermoprotei archaeon ex4572_64]
MAKDVTLTYPEYDRLRDEDDYIQDTKIWYLNIILQNMYFHSGKEIIPDAMRIVLRNIAKIENDYCIKTFRKVRSTINKLEEYRMYVDLNPTEDKFRKDIRGKHHFDIEKEYNKITGKEEVKVWN